jgi:hypothetical protein
MWRQWYEEADELVEVIPAPELSRVLVDNPYEVRRWCQRFICTEGDLKQAVASVGTDPAAVRMQLDARRGGPARSTKRR